MSFKAKYLANRMRDAAKTLAEANEVYGFNADWGVWNPESLRKEAAVVETDETL